MGVARTGATDTKRAVVIIENDVKAFHQNIFKINPVKEGLTMHAVNYIFFRTLSTIVNFMFYFDGKRRTGSDRAHWAVWTNHSPVFRSRDPGLTNHRPGIPSAGPSSDQLET